MRPFLLPVGALDHQAEKFIDAVAVFAFVCFIVYLLDKRDNK